MNLCNHILNRKILGSNTVDPFLLFIVLYPALDNLTENKCRRIAMFNGYGSAEISYLFSLNAASPEEVISTMPNNSELNNIPANWNFTFCND